MKRYVIFELLKKKDYGNKTHNIERKFLVLTCFEFDSKYYFIENFVLIIITVVITTRFYRKNFQQAIQEFLDTTVTLIKVSFPIFTPITSPLTQRLESIRLHLLCCPSPHTRSCSVCNLVADQIIVKYRTNKNIMFHKV